MFHLEHYIKRTFPQWTYSRIQKEVRQWNKRRNFFVKGKSLPYKLKPNQTFRLTGFEFDVIYHINSKGYRGKEIDDVKDKELFRIIIEGDSITFGDGVQNNETFSSLLQEFLNKKSKKKVEVINAGVHAYGPDMYYLSLKEKDIKLLPDLIIVALFLGNDFDELDESEWVRKDKDGLPVVISRYKVSKEGYLLEELPFYYRIPYLRESHLFVFLCRGSIGDFIINFPQRFTRFIKGEDRNSKMFTILRGIRNLCHKSDIKLIFLLIPSIEQMRIYNKNRKKLPSREVIKMCQQLKIKYFDLSKELMREDFESFYYKYDRHFNAKGHKFVAKYLENVVAQFLNLSGTGSLGIK